MAILISFKNHNHNLLTTNVLQVLNSINDLNTSKGTGPQSIPTSIFHLMKYAVAEPLVNIINLSFQTGTYIDDLKISFKSYQYLKTKVANWNTQIADQPLYYQIKTK